MKEHRWDKVPVPLSLLLYVGSPHTYVYNVIVDMDIKNPKITPIIKDNQVLVPLQFFVDTFKCGLSYDQENNKFTIIKGSSKAKIVPGNNEFVINNLSLPLTTPPETIFDRVYVPLAPLVENFLGKRVALVNGLVVVDEKWCTLDYTKATILAKELIQELSSKRGNSLSNLANGATAVQDGEFLYYTGMNWIGNRIGLSRLYKCRLDGSQEKVLDTGYQISGLNIVDGWIYYTTQENTWSSRGIWKIKTDGTGKTVLYQAHSNIYNITVVGDKIYYIDSAEKKLLTMKTDGSNVTSFPTDYSGGGFIEGNKVYILAYHPISVNLDGTNTTKVYDKYFSDFVVSNGYIYGFVQQDNKFWEYNLVKINLLDKRETVIKVLDEWARPNSVNVQGEWIYYNDDGELRRIKIDGTNDTLIYKVENFVISGINIVGDWAFYDLLGNGGGTYKVKLDGTKNRLVK